MNYDLCIMNQVGFKNGGINYYLVKDFVFESPFLSFRPTLFCHSARRGEGDDTYNLSLNTCLFPTKE